jgi:predicted kinase
MKQTLVILRGAPASGKSTISESIRDFDKKIVWFKTDNLKFFFAEPSDSRILDEVMETCLATLDNLLNRGYSIIYEGIFKNPEYAMQAAKIGREKNIPTVIYQLSCSLESLRARDKIRKGVQEGCRKTMPDKIIENLYKMVEDNPIEGAIKLDTEEKSIDECIKIIKHNFE